MTSSKSTVEIAVPCAATKKRLSLESMLVGPVIKI